MSKISINIIEDDKVIRESIITFLGMQSDLEIGIISSSIEDYLLAQKSKPSTSSMLLLDVGLPGMTGIEGIPHIKKLTPEIDIIMLTTYEEEDVIVKALCSGACSYISKKASLKEIGDAIRIVNLGGSYMSPSIARELVSYLNAGKPSKQSILTDRQDEIINLLASGSSYQDISKSLFISLDTVKTHVKNIYQALHVSNRVEAINKYFK